MSRTESRERTAEGLPAGPSATAPPKFLYFDLGKVLVDFSVERMCRQMGEASGVTPDRVWEVLFDGQLQKEAELGRLSGREFYEAFCRKTGTRPDFHALETAACDIFQVNASVAALVAELAQAGYLLGVLSNTCQSHWEYCRRQFPIVAEAFRVQTLSFEVGAMKPQAAIYRAAAEAAGAAPQQIFFVDDHPDNVAGAAGAGFDAVQYTTTERLVADLRSRGVRWNC